jgi:OFA family oxalate/formate antiporter-like MFS transporter
MVMEKHPSKWFNCAIPGVALTTCIGSVYCWSQFSGNLMQAFDITRFQTDIGFTLIIFFLGMCAAIFGNTIEKNPRLGAWLSTTVFITGFIMLGVSVAIQCLPCFYIATAIIGAGTGIGYVTPVKTLMAFFADHKGMASGLAITGFGLAKFIASPVIEWLLATVSLANMFYIMGGIYAAVMVGSSLLLRKYPYMAQEYGSSDFRYGDLLKRKEWWAIWFMFMTNISCGLAIISQEKMLLLGLGIASVAAILSGTALSNAGGRIGFSTLSDKIGRKASYHFVCSFGIMGALFCITGNPVMSVIGILLCEAAYGGNFSVLPSLLARRFGMTNASRIHSLTLTGWSVGGIFGPLLANTFTGTSLYLVLAILYFIAFTVMEMNVKKG